MAVAGRMTTRSQRAGHPAPHEVQEKDRGGPLERKDKGVGSPEKLKKKKKKKVTKADLLAEIERLQTENKELKTQLAEIKLNSTLDRAEKKPKLKRNRPPATEKTGPGEWRETGRYGKGRQGKKKTAGSRRDVERHAMFPDSRSSMTVFR